MCIYSFVYLVQYGLTSSLLPGSGFWCFQSHRYTSNMFYFVLWSELQVAGTIPCCSWDIGIWQWLCTKPGALGDKSKQHVCSMHHFLRINYGKLLRFFDLVKAPYQNLNRIDEAPWVALHHVASLSLRSASGRQQTCSFEELFQNYILCQLRMPASIVWHLLQHLVEGFHGFMPTSSDFIIVQFRCFPSSPAVGKDISVDTFQFKLFGLLWDPLCCLGSHAPS